MLSKGHAYEKVAEQYLLNKGYIIKARNYHTRRGEIDLVMLDGTTLVFIEVKFRNNHFYGTAEETITQKKQSKIVFCAKHYIAKFKLWNMDARFDVITIKPTQKSQLEINWLKNAFH
ncbi:MAG: putative endonuclease [Oleiphilaceae bacterium]|jgi:putative endonuclease